MVVQSVTVTFKLSKEDIREAEKLGLLMPETIANWVQSQLEWERDARRLKEIRGALQRLPDPLTPEDIDAEIAAYRAEKRAGRESGV